MQIQNKNTALRLDFFLYFSNIKAWSTYRLTDRRYAQPNLPMCAVVSNINLTFVYTSPVYVLVSAICSCVIHPLCL